MAPGTRSSKDAKPANSSKHADTNNHDDVKAATTSDSKENVPGKPLGPPPRPAQEGKEGDYFSAKGSHPYQSEPNPFEEQFGTTGTTPKNLLPSVAALTSPSSLLPGDTPGWNSLRAGPLSPAMLAGPAGSDYFDSNYSRGFPTPNESGLRTGLTPGGGGSMFPAPSPNSTALFNSLMGAQTPNTIDFLKTGLNAKAATSTANGDAPTSQPVGAVTRGMDLKMPATTGTDGYANPDADAASGLFMLAQSNGASRAGFAVPSVPRVQVNGSRARKSPEEDMDGLSDSDEEMSDSDTENEAPKRASRSSRTRKPTAKAEKKSPAVRPPNNKRKRSSPPPRDLSPPLSGGKKEKGSMNEEEKRKNFLERNRIAALKCRQRKKQWLNNLQAKVDAYSHDNEVLAQNIKALEAQVMQLKGLLLQHKDCPVTIQQGITPQAFMQFLQNGDLPYGPSHGMQPVGSLGPQVQMMMAPTAQAAFSGP